MITIPAGVRVLLATKPVDFRNYAEPPDMRSGAMDGLTRADHAAPALRIILGVIRSPATWR